MVSLFRMSLRTALLSVLLPAPFAPVAHGATTTGVAFGPLRPCRSRSDYYSFLRSVQCLRSKVFFFQSFIFYRAGFVTASAAHTGCGVGSVVFTPAEDGE